MMTPVKIGAYCYVNAEMFENEATKKETFKHLANQIADKIVEDGLYSVHESIDTYRFDREWPSDAIKVAISVKIVPPEEKNV